MTDPSEHKFDERVDDAISEFYEVLRERSGSQTAAISDPTKAKPPPKAFVSLRLFRSPTLSHHGPARSSGEGISVGTFSNALPGIPGELAAGKIQQARRPFG